MSIHVVARPPHRKWLDGAVSRLFELYAAAGSNAAVATTYEVDGVKCVGTLSVVSVDPPTFTIEVECPPLKRDESPNTHTHDIRATVFGEMVWDRNDTVTATYIDDRAPDVPGYALPRPFKIEYPGAPPLLFVYFKRCRT